MVGALGAVMALADSQTPNGGVTAWLSQAGSWLCRAPSGPSLVSRAGTAGRTEHRVKAPKAIEPRTTKGVLVYGQPGCGHGSRHQLRSA